MAHYQEVDYCSEEVRSVTPAGGYLHPGAGGRHGGVQQHVVKESFQEVDRSGSYGHGRRHNHSSHGSDYLVVRETKVEEDINTCTGEVHERKQSFLYRSD
ncbi:uncharacterized protein LOC102719341 [Oryza brachyantha]|uniref:Uncharacterized protein n=1 Tax=Oryza brachyantha TaxID=4533 RepID=J3L701_ORYBR|nr:uncharacterized protein LOC102719341 [Oryza brachyantha]